MALKIKTCTIIFKLYSKEQHVANNSLFNAHQATLLEYWI